MIPREFLAQYLVANAIALAILGAAFWRRDVARWAVVAVFGWAAVTNATTAIQRPELYLEYATLTPSASYRNLINGWFSQHVQGVVLTIAAGQAIIAGLLASRTPGRQWLGAAGAWIFLLAIAPLGVGSGFPFSLTFGAALLVSLEDARPISTKGRHVMGGRILILYGTSEGHTAKVAAAMADSLRGAGADVDVVKARRSGAGPYPEDYAAVIVAASVHAGMYQRAVRRWVRAHAPALHARPTAFVSVCLAVLERTPDIDRQLGAIMTRFFRSTGWTPAESKVVAGALPYTKYGWLKRWMMRRIVAKAKGDTDTSRDYEYTDWDDLAEFVGRFASGVHLQPEQVAS